MANVLPEGIQSNSLNPNLKASGCYFYCVLEMVGRLLGKSFSISNIDSYYDAAVKGGIMEADCFLISPHTLANLVADRQLFKDVRKVLQVPGENGYTAGIFPRYGKKPGMPGGHFTLWDKGTVWDPLDPKRPAASLYVTDSYREFV